MQRGSRLQKGGYNMVDISTNLGELELINPVIPASGTFGFGKEFMDFYDLNILGGISIKGTTQFERFGNDCPRIAECNSGMLNAVGLQNPGIEKVVSQEIADLRAKFRNIIIANISGFSLDEYRYCADLVDYCDDIDILELNISCPNVKNGGMSFGTSPQAAYEVTKAVKEKCHKPIFVKLSPNVTSIVDIAKAVEEAGADGVCLINTLLGMRVDIKRRKPVLNNIMGGFSGPAIFPVAVRMIYQVRKAVSIPIIGCGGVMTAKDLIEMMMVGANAVEVGTANLIDPYASKKIIEDLPLLMQELGINRLRDIVGII